MPVIEKSTFLKLADRMAAQYELLLDFEVEANINELPAKLEIGSRIPAQGILSAGAARILIKAKVPGEQGNDITINLIDPTDNDFVLNPEILGKEINIYLATDGGGTITNTLEDIYQLLLTYTPYSSFLDVTKIDLDLDELVADTSLTLSGGEGQSSLTLAAKKVGKEGNDLSIALVDPNTINSPLSITITDNKDIVVSLATDGAGAYNTTALGLKTALESNYQANLLLSVELWEDGSGVLEPLAKQNFSGGTNGSYANAVLEEPPSGSDCQADPDVAQMAFPAITLDNGLTARNLMKGIGYIESFQAAIVRHLVNTGVPTLDVYLTTNDIRVHENFSIIQGERTGLRLNADNVFKKSSQLVATFQLSGDPLEAILTPGSSLGVGSGTHSDTNYAAQNLEIELIPASTKASIIFEPTGTNNNFTVTAKEPSSQGNFISLALLDPGDNNEVLAVVVNDYDIEVSLETDGSGNIVTTALELKEAIDASPEASNLVDVILADDGSGVLEAIAVTSLEGGKGPFSENDLIGTIQLLDKSSTLVNITDVYFPARSFPGAKWVISKYSSLTTPQVSSVNDQIRFIAIESGVAGNDITIEFVDPNDVSQAASLTVDLVNKALVYNLATDIAGDITSTALSIKDTFDADVSASTLVRATLPGNGSGVVEALEETNLSGGIEPDRYYNATTFILVSGGTAGDTLKISSKPERSITL